MSPRVVVRPLAEADLLESALFIAEENPIAAQRFSEEAEKAFERVAEFPEIGSPRTAFDGEGNLRGRRASMATASPRRDALAARGAVVLLVESHEDSRGMYAGYLQLCGFTVQTTDTTDE